MTMRKCLNCGEANYSADASIEYWICCKCGNKIFKSQEKPMPKEGVQNDENT